MRWILLVSLLLVAAVPAPAAAATVHVHIQANAFVAKTTTVAVGDTVTWDNHDSAPHTVTSSDGKFASSGNLAQGGAHSATFPQAGTFPYHCKIHSTMTGSIVVQAPQDAPGQNRPPTVSIASPAEGATVSGVVQISGSAGDQDADPVTVEVRIDDGPWQPASGSTSWTFSWDSASFENGTHTIRARAGDGAETTESAARTVTLTRPAAPAPKFELENLVVPAEAQRGSTVNATVDVRNVGNAAGVATVLLLVDGATQDETTREVPPGGRLTARLTYAATAEGTHAVSAALAGASPLPARSLVVTAPPMETGGDEGGDGIPVDAGGDAGTGGQGPGPNGTAPGRGTPAPAALAGLAAFALAALARRLR